MMKTNNLAFIIIDRPRSTTSLTANHLIHNGSLRPVKEHSRIVPPTNAMPEYDPPEV